MKPVRAHSVDPEECARPPGQPARSRGRPQRYTQARNRECPAVTDLAVVSGELGVKLADSAFPRSLARCIFRFAAADAV